MSQVIIDLHGLIAKLRANNNWFMAAELEQILIDLVNESK